MTTAKITMQDFERAISSGNTESLFPNISSKPQRKKIFDGILKEVRNTRNFHRKRERTFLINKRDIIAAACHSLTFAKNQDLIDLLAAHGYIVSDENYLKDLESIIDHNMKCSTNPVIPEVLSESSDFSIRADYMKKMLSVNFDNSTITVKEWLEHEGQVITNANE